MTPGQFATYDPNRCFDVDSFDVQYGRWGHGALLARVYRPRARGPFPAILDVHGGIWTYLDRTADAPLDEALAASGIVVVSIDFRLAPVLAQHEHPSCSSDGFIDTVPSPEYDGTRPLWIDEFSENKSRCTNGDASWTSGRISAYNSAGYHWTHSNWRQPDIGTWQNNVAADFTQPWTQMQNAVFPNWSGLVHPT